MAISPAAVASLFVQSQDHEQARIEKLRDRLALMCEIEGLYAGEALSRLQSETSSSTPKLTLMSRPQGLPRVDGWIWVAHSDGHHENVCLEEERMLFLDLVRDRTIDAVQFCIGLPTGRSGIFSAKYAPASVHGTRPFVALQLLRRPYVADVEQLVVPITRLLEQRWEELALDQDFVEILPQDQAAFLRSCAGLPYFADLSTVLNAAAMSA